MVKGDYHKYEAMTWQNRGYSGGIKDLDIHYTSGDDITIDAGGRGIIGNGDYKGYYSLKNKDVGYVDVDFKQFRKYYDTYGGIYQGFSPSLSRDLSLDIGHFGIEAGITMPDLPNVSVYYDHDYKDGDKSILEWNAMTGFSTMRICPAWKEIKETVDTFGIKADHTHNGYHLTGDQRWEIAKTKTLAVEPVVRMVTITSPTTPGDQLRQYYTTDATLMTTTLGADKWYLNDKAFVSSAYRFAHLKNDQVQKRVTANSSGGITAATYPGSDGQNVQDVNSWVLNLMVNPWNCLSGTGSIKAEVSQRDGVSYNRNASGSSIPKGEANSNTYKLAEAFGLRFKAIPRTVVYSDLSFEQSQNHLDVIRSETVGATAGVRSESRDAIIDEPVITWSMGADFQPVRFLNLTSQVRLRDKSMNFHDDPVRSNPFDGQVFMEKLNTHSISFTQRATVKLSGLAQTSFRYLLDDTTFDSRATRETADSKARSLSNNFIYDLSVYPLSNLSMTGSFSQFYAETKTVASSFPGSTAGWCRPAFTSNSSTWMFTTDYQPHKKVSVDGNLYYTVANNNSNNVMNENTWPNFEASYNQLGLSLGCKWDVSKDLSVTPRYGFERYLPDAKSGIGGAYDAQILSIVLTQAWG